MNWDILSNIRTFVRVMPGLGKRKDRKSTRLNSSHLVISYAVFCLIIKNQQRLRLEAPRVRVAVARLAQPDLSAVLVQLSGELDHAPERLDTGDVEDDAVALLDLLR